MGFCTFKYMYIIMHKAFANLSVKCKYMSMAGRWCQCHLCLKRVLCVCKVCPFYLFGIGMTVEMR